MYHAGIPEPEGLVFPLSLFEAKLKTNDRQFAGFLFPGIDQYHIKIILLDARAYRGNIERASKEYRKKRIAGESAVNGRRVAG